MKALLHFIAQPAFYLPLLAGILLSSLSNLFGWDLFLANLFYDAQADRWLGPEIGSMKWLYLYGVLPALICGIVASIVAILGFSIPWLRPFRRISLYFFLVLALGSGLIANALLKQYWGRPRPSQVLKFGGTQNFEPSLWYDALSTGHSFPSGHATMGFYFFSLALLLNGQARFAAFALALGFGSILGFSRITYGGHFFTDVLWSGIIMWIVARSVHQFFGLNSGWSYCDRPPYSKGEAFRRKLRSLFVIPALTLGLLVMVTHVPRDKNDQLIVPLEGVATVQLQMEQMRGILKIESSGGKQIHVRSNGLGFGLPKTRLLLKHTITTQPDLMQLNVRHNVQGFFSDLKATTTLTLPEGPHYDIQIDPAKLEGLIVNGRVQTVPAEALLQFKLD